MFWPFGKKIRVIKHVINEKSGQRFVVLNRLPDFKYVKKGNLLLAEDSGFYSCYYYGRPDKYSQAFAGRKFDIPMLDGSVIKASGQWWNGEHPIYKEIKAVRHGYSTIDKLKRCFVFTGGVLFNESLLNTCAKNPVEYWELERKLRAVQNTNGY